MKKTLGTVVALGLAASLGLANSALAETDLTDEKSKKSYSLGLMIADRITKRYGELDYDALIEAIKLQHEGGDVALTLQEAQSTLQAYEQRAAEEKSAAAKAEGEKYLSENAKREGVMVTDSGLQYEVITEGDGDKPTAESKVSVHYVGTLTDGTEFDSSIARGQPAEFGVTGVIPGWTEGLQLMNVGSKYRFVIPSDLAYGDRGAGGQIGPGETLVFEVELLEIK